MGSDYAVLYMLWVPWMVLLAILWFREMNAFRVAGRKDRPRVRMAYAVAYLVSSWIPLIYTLVAS